MRESILDTKSDERSRLFSDHQGSCLGHICTREGVNDCFTGLGWTPERNTKSYSEKDCRERVKQSEVEELGSSQSGCTREKVLVRQRGGQLGRQDMMIMMMIMIMKDFYG